MGFFFSDSQDTPAANLKKIPIHSAKKLGCKICPLNKVKISSPKLEPQGSDTPIYYFLFSKVSYEQDEAGDYLAGEDIEYLISMLSDDVLENSRFNSITNCFAAKEVDDLTLTCCRSRIELDIEETRPKVIIPIGPEAMRWLIDEGNLNLYAGKFMPISVLQDNYWMYPINDPGYILSRQKSKKRKDGTKYKMKTEWDQLLEEHVERLEDFDANLPVWIPKKALLREGIEWSDKCDETHLNQIFKALDFLGSAEIVSLDIETNQLSPYRSDSRMISISVGTYDYCIAFPYEYRTGVWSKKHFDALKKRFKEFLMKTTRFVCHNAKFEQEWLAVIFGREILDDWEKWECSQAQAYVLCETSRTHSLDFLIRLYFGFNLKIISNLDRANLEKYELSEVLPYNGLDVKWTYPLYYKQKAQIDGTTLETVYKDLKRSSATLVKTQMNGVEPDKEEVQMLLDDLSSKIAEVYSKIRSMPDVKKYEAKHGQFNHDSPNQVLVFLKNIAGLDDELKVEGKYSTDESVLSRISHPIGKLILENRALTKKKGTYVDPISNHSNTVDGRIHAQFNHLFTTTGRLSSNDPNLQNFPNRKGREIRKVIRAPEGSWLVCSDYGQIEGRLIAVASQDPVYCGMIWDDYDVHLDWAERIANEYNEILDPKLDDKAAVKKFRKDVKNQWTFPQFYGSSIYSIARGMKIPIEIMLKMNEEFWDVFGGIKRWQEWLVKFYKQHGYVETLMGHRRRGPLTYNEIINTPIQGTAGRLCINAMNKVCDAGIETVMQIHDDISSYIPDESLEEGIDTVARIMCDTSDYPWINVPIAVEIGIGPNWFDQEEIGVFKSTDYIEVDKTLHRNFDFYQEYL